ncbi:hypothetical protein CK203_033570 [Vitis vinifera]|uniref:RING-CH-type domain-containing protein n=1 Tax=Vitis vinifera TaxID=29760 RepID=A0A438FLL6_VITVI|nr:hypothetical protein CK203_033570 [Vitis vinifera]
MSTVEKRHGDVEEGGRRGSGGVGGSYGDEEQRCSRGPGTEIVGVSEKGRESSVSECSVDVDLGRGVPEIKVHLAKVERDCRICHLSLDSTNLESGIPIELGCSCKADLAAAHKQLQRRGSRLRATTHSILECRLLEDAPSSASFKRILRGAIDMAALDRVFHSVIP